MALGSETRTWDYRMLDALGPAPDLEALGRDGWELVGVGAGATQSGHALYFKRPAPGLRERVTLDQKREVYARAGLALPDVEGPQA